MKQLYGIIALILMIGLVSGLLPADAVPAGFQQVTEKVTKTCGYCGKPAPPDAKVGDTCKFCHRTWGRKKIIRKTVTVSKAKHPAPMSNGTPDVSINTLPGKGHNGITHLVFRKIVDFVNKTGLPVHVHLVAPSMTFDVPANGIKSFDASVDELEWKYEIRAGSHSLSGHRGIGMLYGGGSTWELALAKTSSRGNATLQESIIPHRVSKTFYQLDPKDNKLEVTRSSLVDFSEESTKSALDRIRASTRSQLPAPYAGTDVIVGSAEPRDVLTIENRTGYSLLLHFVGPTIRTVKVDDGMIYETDIEKTLHVEGETTSNGDDDSRLREGDYEIAAETWQEPAHLFYGKQTYHGGKYYRLTFSK